MAEFDDIRDPGQGTEFPVLHRPRLLMSAARAGQTDYNRNRDLRRLMRGAVPSPCAAVRRLTEEEALAEDSRRAGDAGYSVTRHVSLLIALLAETRLSRAATR